jgi:precorrin-6Y C5,15-methyltransferase (decarboxylating)
VTGEKWLTIVGIGEDGVEGLSAVARAKVVGAGLVVGGARHLELAAPLIRGRRMTWPTPLADAVGEIVSARADKVAVLASGDPFWFGVGSVLARSIPPEEMLCLPAPSAFALACARLGWALQDVATISFCGRDLACLAPLLQPNARILALSEDATTPGLVAGMLTSRGLGTARLHVLEALGGPRERVRTVAAGEFALADVLSLNVVALELGSAPGAIPFSTGLDDAAFAHDGQITKREIRAVTLSALAPRRGELLWDIGCGSGSVGIEWMLRHPANHAVGVERDAARAARARANAARLGVPALRVIEGEAPAALADLPRPNAVFIGGGAQDPAVIDAAWDALPPDGRIVVNAVTIETEVVLVTTCRAYGGTLTRLSVARMDAVGHMHAFRPAMTVTQWAATHP